MEYDEFVVIWCFRVERNMSAVGGWVSHRLGSTEIL